VSLLRGAYLALALGLIGFGLGVLAAAWRPAAPRGHLFVALLIVALVVATAGGVVATILEQRAAQPW